MDASASDRRRLGLPDRGTRRVHALLTLRRPYRIDEHTADQVNGRLIRTVDVHCGFCGARRKMYFRVVAAGS